ncbi:MAG: hypothetical protein M2R45_01505 [Verrucomicrobia subdivision 3 bacterium]|nr:hypothetical protein [Limisphaerales bacterium]MCS1413366.1 hypothetical protein [Limisphaerales bacterium]
MFRKPVESITTGTNINKNDPFHGFIVVVWGEGYNSSSIQTYLSRAPITGSYELASRNPLIKLSVPIDA